MHSHRVPAMPRSAAMSVSRTCRSGRKAGGTGFGVGLRLNLPPAPVILTVPRRAAISTLMAARLGPQRRQRVRQCTEYPCEIQRWLSTTSRVHQWRNSDVSYRMGWQDRSTSSTLHFSLWFQRRGPPDHDSYSTRTCATQALYS